MADKENIMKIPFFGLILPLQMITMIYPLGLFIVADGMGGHQYGEVASSAATKALSEHIIEEIIFTCFWIISRSAV